MPSETVADGETLSDAPAASVSGETDETPSASSSVPEFTCVAPVFVHSPASFHVPVPSFVTASGTPDWKSAIAADKVAGNALSPFRTSSVAAAPDSASITPVSVQGPVPAFSSVISPS